MTTPGKTDLLDRVRKLLAKAEDEGCTTEEAEALTAKASELMARYGIDRALLGSLHPETDRVTDRVFDLDNPWGAVKAHLLAGLASAMRCQCILLNRRKPGSRVHVFGYQSDLDRVDILFTSLLVQMHHGLVRVTNTPGSAFSEAMVMHHSAKAWRRSWMLGYASAVVSRVREAEQAAVKTADAERTTGGTSAELVLADRSLVVNSAVNTAYPKTRKTRVTYSGNGYADGYRQGQKADIGGSKVGAGRGRSLTS
jgi:Protein of unknown function (DUF2786)